MAKCFSDPATLQMTEVNLLVLFFTLDLREHEEEELLSSLVCYLKLHYAGFCRDTNRGEGTIALSSLFFFF